MNRRIKSGLIVMIFILGGCSTSVEEGEKVQTTNKLQLETRAFQDDFTRGFMDSSEEVQDGFYRLKSKTEGYTMLFPINAKIDTVTYGINSDFYETYSFGERDKKENTSFYYQIAFEDRPITENIDVNLDLLSTYAGYEGKYKKFVYEGKTYHYATDVFKVDDGENYKYFTYIKSNKSNKAIRYFASSTCLSESKECNASSKEIEERFLFLMKSVDFSE